MKKSERNPDNIPNEYTIYAYPFCLLSDEAKERIREWRNSKQESVERLSWEDTFIRQAYEARNRSLDAQTKNGCVLVKDNVPLTTGYNSFIRDIDDSILPNCRPDKYPWMFHAEHNAITNCARNGSSTLGATAYLTDHPCNPCLQMLYQAGVKEIIFSREKSSDMISNNPEYELEKEILLWLLRDKIVIKEVPFKEIYIA